MSDSDKIVAENPWAFRTETLLEVLGRNPGNESIESELDRREIDSDGPGTWSA